MNQSFPSLLGLAFLLCATPAPGRCLAPISRRRREADVLAGLPSWSPVARKRSAMELARRETAPMARLIEMLDASALDTCYGACQALIAPKDRAAPAVEALRHTLKAEDLWPRVKAAEALASIGGAAKSEIPKIRALEGELIAKN